MDRRQSTHADVVIQGYVAGQGRAVGEDDVVADPAVVPDVGIDHEQVIVPDAGLHATAARADVERRELADRIPVADRQRTVLPAILHVLRNGAHAGELENPVVAADRRAALHHAVRSHARIPAEAHVRADHRVRADLHAAVQFGARGHDRGGVYGRLAAHAGVSSSGATSATVNSSSATIFPSTRALPSIFQNVPRRR